MAYYGKPYNPEGPITNFMVLRDATATPNVSPLALGTTTTLKVPPSATRLILMSNEGAGTYQISKGGTAEDGVFTFPANTLVVLDIAGMSDGTGTGPDEVVVTSGTDVLSFGFACNRINGD